AATVVSAVLVALSIGLAAATTWIGGELRGEGTVFSGLEDVLTTHLLVIVAALLFSLAMGILLQSTVISLVVAIGLPFVISTAGTVAMAFGSELIRSEEHTSERQSRFDLVCRLLLEKNKE